MAHARAPRAPLGAIAVLAQDEGGKEGGNKQGGMGVHELDARPVRCGQLRSTAEGAAIAYQQTKNSRRPARTALQLEAKTMPRDHRDRRIVGRIDGVDSKAQTIGEKTERLLQLSAGQDDLRFDSHTGAKRKPFRDAAAMSSEITNLSTLGRLPPCFADWND